MQHAHFCQFRTLNTLRENNYTSGQLYDKRRKQGTQSLLLQIHQQNSGGITQSTQSLWHKTIKVDENGLFKLDRNEKRNKMRNEHSFRR